MAILVNYRDNFDPVSKQSKIVFLNNIGQLSTISLVILGNLKDNYDTTTTTAIKSMGVCLSATQSCDLYSFFEPGYSLGSRF